MAPPDESTARRGRRVALFAVITSLIVLSIGIYKIMRNYQFSQKAIHAQGTVVDFDTYEGPSSDEDESANTTFYMPVFEYEVNGQLYQEKGNSTSSPGYALGEKVQILIDPADPQKVLVNTFRERWLVPLIFCGASLIMIFVAWLAKRYGW